MISRRTAIGGLGAALATIAVSPGFADPINSSEKTIY